MPRITYIPVNPINPDGTMQIDARFKANAPMDLKDFGDKTAAIHKFFKEHADFFTQNGLSPSTIKFSIATIPN